MPPSGDLVSRTYLCDAQQVCPDAVLQGLAECQPNGDSCICQRGYVLHAGICVGEYTKKTALIPSGKMTHDSVIEDSILIYHDGTYHENISFGKS